MRRAEGDREADLKRRLAAFPASGKDRALAAAIAKPAAARELDLRASGGKDRVTVIPPAVKKLVALEVLRLDGNRLPEFPEEVASCRSLRELYLAGNAIARINPRVLALGKLAVVDVRDNQLAQIYARAKVPMRLELAGNPLGPDEDGKLTRSMIGDLRKIVHLGIDTDALFPVNVDSLAVEYPKVKVLPMESVALTGRKPTAAELAALAKLFPKARVEHR